MASDAISPTALSFTHSCRVQVILVEMATFRPGKTVQPLSRYMLIKQVKRELCEGYDISG